MRYLSVVIPAYNEAERIGPTLERVFAYLAEQSFSSEVVVVDDGSRDATVRLVRSLRASHPSLRVIANAENKGKGGVVRQGMLEAAGEWRLFMDADGSTPIGELGKLLDASAEHDIVIGSRRLDRSLVLVRQP